MEPDIYSLSKVGLRKEQIEEIDYTVSKMKKQS